jgi:hypothetical protein
MMKILVLGAAILPMAIVSPSLASTEAECASAWKTADVNSDGVLTEIESKNYGASLRAANKTVPEKGIDETLFLQNCKDGVFASADAAAGAPLKGANSFTEAQAKDRITGKGLTGVSELKKDADGIWRGTASEGGKAVNVSVDFKGNVVTN